MKSPRILLTSVLAAGGLAAAWFTGLLGRAVTTLKTVLVHCLEYIGSLDPVLAALSFIGLYIVATIFFFPGLLITMGAGFLFGPVKGAALVSVASVSGSSLCFLIGRYLARNWVSGKTANSPRFRAIDEAVGRDGGRIVLLLRLSPLFPYNLLNYALGLTRVKFRSYVLASWIGMLPGTLLYVYLGSAAGSLASLVTGVGQERTPAQWALFGTGLAATALVSIYVTKLAKRSLDEQLASA